MEFDKNGMLKPQKIKQKVSHEIDHDRLYLLIRKKQSKKIITKKKK